MTEFADFAPVREVVRMRAGSHLYGTATASSDLDLKAVVLPGARDILLRRVRSTVTEGRPRARGERNTPDDVDVEAHSLQRYLALLVAGQPIAVEMLFAPDDAFTAPPDPLWREVQSLGPRLLTRHVGVSLRYCRKQAELYGTKGARAATARRTAGVLAASEAAYGAQARLERAAAEYGGIPAEAPHVALLDVEVQPGRVVRHLEVCGRKTPYTATIRVAREGAERALAGYGRRAEGAERHDGVDWKALSHAVRVGREAVEPLSTGRLHLPFTAAPHLLAIKLGRMPYGAVEDEIEALRGDVERAAERSALPDEPDHETAEALVLRAHRRQVLGRAFGADA